MANEFKIKNGLMSFSQLYPRPTCAIVESIEILDYNHNQMIYIKVRTSIPQWTRIEPIVHCMIIYSIMILYQSTWLWSWYAMMLQATG